MEHLNGPHDAPGQKTAGEEHEEENADCRRGHPFEELEQRGIRFGRILTDERDPLNADPAETLRSKRDGKLDRRIPHDPISSAMRIVFGDHPPRFGLPDLFHQLRVDRMAVRRENRADQRPPGGIQQHRMAMLAKADLLDRVEQFVPL